MLCQLVIYQIYKHSSQSIFTISVSGCIVMIVKKKSEEFHQGQCVFKTEKETEVCRIQNIFTIFKNICLRELFLWHHSNVSFRDMIYGIWQFHYTTNCEEIIPYLCGLWCFVNT